MKKTKLLLGLFLIAISFIACNPSDDSGSSQNDDKFAENFGNAASKDFIGQIVDTDNNPIQNVSVTIGTTTVQTDVNGVFIINGASVYEKFAFIKATKAGYFDGSRAMIPTSGKNNVKIMLIPNAPLETITSGVESEVEIYSGTKVKFDGTFQDEDGNDYTGNVQVSMFHLTSSDENLDSLMPGMLYAQTSTNEEAVLETFGMMNVELRGSSGQKLNIANGHTAEITMRIDDSQLATAPNTIPLWHFDEAKGYWKEDGVAAKVGNKYVGEVSHFSWWNCDVPFQVVNFTVTVVDANNNPLPNLMVAIVYDFPRSNVTDSNGTVSGLIPANQVMTLNIFDHCGDIISSTQVGPFTTDTAIQNIVVNNGSATKNTVVVGDLLKCNGSKVTNGYVMLNNNNVITIQAVTDGAFSFHSNYCVSQPRFLLKGVNFEDAQQTDYITYNFKEITTTIGSILCCDTADEYLTYKIDNNAPEIFDVNVNYELVPYPNNVFWYTINANDALGNQFRVSGINQVGVYTDPAGWQMYSQKGFLPGSTHLFWGYDHGSVTYEVNNVGDVGEYTDIVFRGTFTISSIQHTIYGLYHVKRQN